MLFALKQGDAGQPIADVCRQMGISEATYYVSATPIWGSWRSGSLGS